MKKEWSPPELTCLYVEDTNGPIEGRNSDGWTSTGIPGELVLTGS